MKTKLSDLLSKLKQLGTELRSVKNSHANDLQQFKRQMETTVTNVCSSTLSGIVSNDIHTNVVT